MTRRGTQGAPQAERSAEQLAGCPLPVPPCVTWDPLAETRRCRRDRPHLVAARVAARVNPFVEIPAL
jgi:hypothetical protein